MAEQHAGRGSRACLLFAGLSVAAVLLWQFLTVRYNYDGDWTALFHIGAYTTPPPALASERVYSFRGNPGYDGQFYHYVAHDPFLARGFARYVDNPRLRWRRILVPVLAYSLALGRDEFVDTAYLVVTLAFVFLGVWWLSQYCSRHWVNPVWGLSFVLVPAVLVSLDRLTIDLALSALCVGFALYAERGPPWKLYLVLALAPLVRETGLCLVAAYCLFALVRRRYRHAVVFPTSVLPYLAWLLVVQQRTPPDFTHWTSIIPFSGIVTRTLHPVQFPLLTRWLRFAAALDYLALLGVWAGVCVAVRLAWKKPLGPVQVAAWVLVGALMFVSKLDVWSQAYSFARTQSPLLLLVALAGVASHTWWYLVPLGMAVPRIIFQLKPQFDGILRGLFSG